MIFFNNELYIVKTSDTGNHHVTAARCELDVTRFSRKSLRNVRFFPKNLTTKNIRIIFINHQEREIKQMAEIPWQNLPEQFPRVSRHANSAAIESSTRQNQEISVFIAQMFIN